jgi:hypothetical protein
LREIEEALKPWIEGQVAHCGPKGFCGPWVENVWISDFSAKAAAETTCLSDTFGPFVPLFIPWVDLYVGSRFKYPDGFVEAVKKVIRPDVPYITVSQNDEGLIGANHLPLIHNILVMSAGGLGHVPIPLFMKDFPVVDPKPTIRKYLTSYVGSLTHAPQNMRQRMNETLAHQLNKDSSSHPPSYTYYYGKGWRDVMANSWTSLAPRGFGRTAYHVMEILQMGLIPVYIYNDIPWVPYANLFESFGFIATLDELPALVERLQQMTHADFRQREARIVRYRDSHFSMPGVMHQIGLFMTGRTGDLQCMALPILLRGIGRNEQPLY